MALMFARGSKCEIEFLGETEEYSKLFDPPVPAKEILPEWYKQMQNYLTEERVADKQGIFNSTVKQCMPVLDAMTAGYIYTMPQDLHVTFNQDGEVRTSWPVSGVPLIQSHDAGQIKHYKIDTEHFSPVVLKLLNKWVIRTPPGYSTLFLSPVWRDDYRMQILPGLVDTDRYPQPINFPFFVRRGFVGTIEVGTPVVQLIPFKRDDWKSKTGTVTEEMHMQWKRATRHSIHRYKKHFRSLKKWS